MICPDCRNILPASLHCERCQGSGELTTDNTKNTKPDSVPSVPSVVPPPESAQ